MVFLLIDLHVQLIHQHALELILHNHLMLHVGASSRGVRQANGASLTEII
jgi:hypothetical protein